MARITRVAHAQQRYEQVTVLDENGQPKRTPVMRASGQQKLTKNGRPVFRTVTVEDKSKPLPSRKCERCHAEIQVGDPYKHISPKSGPYGGHTRYRCAKCPDWQVWEYSGSLSAQVAQISHDFWDAMSSVESEDDVQSALDDAASAVRELAEQKRESAQNIEDGFGHSTSASDDLNDVADQLDEWANEIESAQIPELPEHEAEDDEDDDGDERTDEEMQAWHDDLAAELTIVDECPV